LRRVQDLLLHPQEGVISLSGDGTIEAWTAFSEVTLARQVAERLREARNDCATTTLLSGDDARALQTSLAELDEPILPLDACSRHRPILSVLALALRLRWQPLDPLHLLEFLTHPVSPVGGRLRRRLAKVVAEFPGIGSTAWNDAIAKVRTRLQTEHRTDAKQLNSELTRVASDLADWINAPRFASTTGAPGSALTATCQAVEQWARERALTRASEAERGQFLAAATQAAELGALLQELPSVTPAEVDRLLEQTGSGGADCGDEFAEAGHVHRARSPGAVLENPDVLVWWDFQGSPGAKGSNWTRAETAVFQDQGIELIPTAAAFDAATLAAFRPIIAARERLILAVPRQRAGKPVPMHPLHNRLDALLKGGLPLRDLDEEIRHGTGVARLRTFGRHPLPPLKRWWKLTSGHRLAARETESFTGIQMLVYDPFAWVLRYKAKLQPGALESIDERRQRGNLLHRVTERIFIDHAPVNWRSATQPEFSAWLQSYWPKLLATEGANFLLPGRQGDGERLRQEAQMAVWRLITHLRTANVSRADSKVRPNDAPFGSGTLTGEIDLIVETPAGACAVIDLKASGLARKQAELVKSIPLQLATYGFLRHAAGGTWPVGAYFISRRGMLLAEDRAFFSGARVSASKHPPGGLEACWRDFERIWQWRLNQLARGWVELPLPSSMPSDGTTSEPASAPPDPRWAKDPKAKRYDPYTALSGWNPEQ
jgi:hypothetical protein